jgi:hypothetical protein
MFISYEYIKYLGYNSKTKEYSYQYRIIDSDFEEVAVGVGVVVAVEVRVGVAVIDAYEKRNLPVAPNLMKAIFCFSKIYGYTVGNIIAWNKQYNPKFSKYEKDIEKYLILM